MKRITYILIFLSFFIYTEKLFCQLEILKGNQVLGTKVNCEGFILSNTFNFKAEKGKSLTIKIDPSCAKSISEAKISAEQNYIVTITPLDGTKVATYENNYLKVDLGSRANVSIQYFDGLGRPNETIQFGATPNKRDIIQLQEYDSFGRESKAWLPINSSIAASGAYRTAQDIKNQSNTVFSDNTGFSEAIYESSPLNRVLGQQGPGNAWANNPVKINYLTNNNNATTYSCLSYTVGGTKAAPTLIKGNNYANGELFVTETKDEIGNTFSEFKNKFGEVVLTRQVNGSDKLDTYYVYDDFGNLCFVLPPLIEGKIDDTNLNLYAYRYKYDERNRCISKKLPGCNWINYVYDKADRLIFSQDGEQARKKEWAYSIPDVFGRIVLLGICKNTDISNANYNSKLVIATFNKNTETNFGYTISGLVSALNSNTIFTANYYDNYDFRAKTEFSKLTYTAKSGYGTDYGNSRGLLTGTAVALLDGSNNYQYVAMYYDYKGNIVQTNSTNHLGGEEKEYMAYTFTGQPTKKEHVHTATAKPTQTELYTYTYDHAGRLLTTKHKYNGGSEVTLVQNTYNELGQLQTSTSAGQTNLKTTYTYNIRSWPKMIVSHHYNQTLNYNLNGNINWMNWGQDGKNRTYTFEYDGLSQIKKADYTTYTPDESKYSTSYSYDKHGNITTLNREGLVASNMYDSIDKLTLEYTGNQLKNIIDVAPDVQLSTSADFKDKKSATNVVEYTFNEDGAMTTDLNKGISISYNSLNLPQEMIINHPSAKAKNYYTYNAAGTKLKVVHKFDPKLQSTPILGSNASDGALTTTMTTDYVGNKIYEGGVLSKILVDNGYIENGKYYFYIKDHLGNNRIVADASGTVIQSNQYYPFGMIFAESTGQDKQDFKYNGKELDRMHGLNLYDYSARYYDPIVPRFTSIDPLAEKYYSISPYAYVANNPMRFVDPTGMLISTDVERNKDGTYNVVGGKLDGDLNIYVVENGVRTGEILGRTITESSFHYSEGEQWLGKINPKDRSGREFLQKFKKDDLDIGYYMEKAVGNAPYDFKVTNGTDEIIYTRSEDHYRGMPLGINKKGITIFSSARDVGNLAAGYIAGRYGISWDMARKEFDKLETKQHNGQITTEGASTQNAQYNGWISGNRYFREHVGGTVAKWIKTIPSGIKYLRNK